MQTQRPILCLGELILFIYIYSMLPMQEAQDSLREGAPALLELCQCRL